MTNEEQGKLDKLENEATQFAAHLLSRTLREPLDSPNLQRLKRITNKASDRTERRYQTQLASLQAKPEERVLRRSLSLTSFF